MNTKSDNTPESIGVNDPGYSRSSTQPFFWSVRARVMGKPFDLRRTTDCRRSRIVRFPGRLLSSARSPALSNVA